MALGVWCIRIRHKVSRSKDPPRRGGGGTGLCQCVAGESDRVQERLRRQGAIVLCVDGVHFDAGSPVLYVQRDAISGDVLYAERRLAQGTSDLVPMLRRTQALAAEIGVPIIGIASDKEKSLVPAIVEVFPTVPHQLCQTHFLKNVAKPLQADDRTLAGVAKETVVAVRAVQRTIERRFPAVAVGGGLVAPPPPHPPSDRRFPRVWCQVVVGLGRRVGCRGVVGLGRRVGCRGVVGLGRRVGCRGVVEFPVGELDVEGLVDQAAQPRGDVDGFLRAESVEPAPYLGVDTEADGGLSACWACYSRGPARNPLFDATR